MTGGINHLHSTLWLWLGRPGCMPEGGGVGASQGRWLQVLLPSPLGLSPPHFELSTCVPGGLAGRERVDGAMD